MIQDHRYKIVKYTINNCPDGLLSALADFYIFMFNNSSDHFFVNRETGESLSRGNIPELAGFKEGYISNAVVKKLYNKIYKDKGYALWHDPEIVLKNIERKLDPDGQLVVLVDTETKDKIKGFTFGRKCTLIEALETEEWLNPYIYSELFKNRRFNRKKAGFLEGINSFLKVRSPIYGFSKVTLDTPIYCWNAAGIAPDLQGNGYMRAINDVFFHSIPKSWGDLLLLGEASDKQTGSATHPKPSNLDNFQKVGAEPIMQMDDDLYLIGVPVKQFMRGFKIKSGMVQTENLK